MDSNAWIQLITLSILPALVAGFSAWLAAKYGVKKVETKVDVVEQKLDGRLTQFVAALKERNELDVSRALSEGERRGVEKQKISGQEMQGMVDAAATGAVEAGEAKKDRGKEHHQPQTVVKQTVEEQTVVKQVIEEEKEEEKK